MQRYSIIKDKNQREIVLLRGCGCAWKKCTFCDYHLDSSKNPEENFKINKKALDRVSGLYRHLEVINSGSFPELDKKTLDYIEQVCEKLHIKTLHFECHYLYRDAIPALRERFKKIGTELKIKIGIESFNYDFREKILHKGIDSHDPREIAVGFDECCLLFGIKGQSSEGMISDIEIGLANFERVCVNIFIENRTKIKPDSDVINEFITDVLPKYKDNPRVDILLNNTDFGVGGE